MAPIAVAVLAGLALGMAGLVLSPALTLLAVIGAGVLALAISRPELGLLMILGTLATVIYESQLPILDIGFGSLHVTDILLLALLAVVLLRAVLEPERFVHTKLDTPMLLMFGAALAATVLGVVRSTVSAQSALRELRTFSHYLSFFVVTNLVVRGDRRRLLIRAVEVLGVLVALAMVAQFAVGESVQLFPGRVETLYNESKAYTGVTRILPPGQSLVMVSFISVAVSLLVNRQRSLSMITVAQLGILGLGLVLTFNRNFWAAAGVAILLAGVLVNSYGRRRLVKLGLALGGAAAVVLVIMALAFPERTSNLTRGVLERFGTFGSGQTLEENSLKFRYRENEYALRQVAAHPVLGMGLGAKYRPWDRRLDSDHFDGRAYIHNGHLWMLLDIGVVGYLCFAWVSISFVVRGLRHWRFVPDASLRATVLSSVLTYLVLMAAALVNPVYFQAFWTPVLALLLGLGEAAVLTSQRRSESWA